MHPEIQVHEEDGVRTHSVVQTFHNGFCAVCNRLALDMREISLTDEYTSGEPKTHNVTVFICAGCLYRIAAQDDPSKELFNGILQPAA
jgi:hypothetical protein